MTLYKVIQNNSFYKPSFVVVPFFKQGTAERRFRLLGVDQRKFTCLHDYVKKDDIGLLIGEDQACEFHAGVASAWFGVYHLLINEQLIYVPKSITKKVTKEDL